MTEYIIIYLLLLILLLYDFSTSKYSEKVRLIYFIGFCILLLSGLRWKTGTDWDNYYYYYRTNFDGTKIGHSGFEFFYELFIRLMYLYTESYSYVLFFTCLIIIICTYKTILKFSPYPIFSIFLLFTYSLNSSGFGYRQDIAIAITTFSVISVYKRNFIQFLILVLIASQFHQSAIIFILAYWIPKFRWNKRTVLLLIFGIVSLILIFSNITSLAGIYSDSAQDKIDTYTSGDFEDSVGDSSNPYVVLIRGIFNRLFILIFILIILKIYIKKENVKHIIFFFNLYIFGFLIFITASPTAVVFIRFTRYFDMFFIILIPLCLYFIPPKARFNALILLLFYTSIKFILFLYLDDKIFVPYNSIFT